MDKLNAVSQVQCVESSSDDLDHLIRPMTLTIEKIEAIWLKLQNLPYVFDDFTRGNKEKFMERFMQVNTVADELGDFGIAYFTDVCPPVNACVHIEFWDRRFKDRVPLARCGIKRFFDNYDIHRLTAVIPVFNRAAILFARRIGFSMEGVLQEATLSLGKWHDNAILGLTRTRFEHPILQSVSDQPGEKDG